MRQTQEKGTRRRTRTTARCHDCLHAEIRQSGNNPAIARCKADPARPPEVAMARIICKLFEPDGSKLPGAAGGKTQEGHGTP